MPPPGTQLLELVTAVNWPAFDHPRFAAAIVCEENALSALSEGSSVTLPSPFVQAEATVQITVPLVFDPDYSTDTFPDGAWVGESPEDCFPVNRMVIGCHPSGSC